MGLEGFRRMWFVLLSHPADFTPVFATEFIAFAQIYDELKKRNVEFLGLSVDSLKSHITWIRNIEEKMDVKIPFPVIADLNKEVAKKFGVVYPEQSNTETFRCILISTRKQDKGYARIPPYDGKKHEGNPKAHRRPPDDRQTQGDDPANRNPSDPVIVPYPRTVEGRIRR